VERLQRKEKKIVQFELGLSYDQLDAGMKALFTEIVSAEAAEKIEAKRRVRMELLRTNQRTETIGD